MADEKIVADSGHELFLSKLGDKFIEKFENDDLLSQKIASYLAVKIKENDTIAQKILSNEELQEAIVDVLVDLIESAI